MKVLTPVLLLLLLMAVTVPVAGLTPQAVKAVVSTKFTISQNAVVSVAPTGSPTYTDKATVIIESTPSGAEIWNYGIYPSGHYTPETIAVNSGPSGVSFMLVYPGYQNYNSTLPAMLLPGQTYKISATLIPLGSATPGVTYQPEYNPTSSSPDYVSNVNQQLTSQQTPSQTAKTGSQPSQSPAPGTGSLSVTTNPTGAAIEVDGIPAGASPATIPGLSAGMHTLTITMPGYAALITQVNIVGGQTMDYSTTLIPATNPTKPKSPGFEISVAGLAVACIVFLKRPA
jgi:hypothetical protein